MDVLERLTAVLKERKSASSESPQRRASARIESSYVASLYQGGLDLILKKLGEEATETIVAAKNVSDSGRDQALVHEVADLWFHSMVMLVHLGQEPGWVLDELERRAGVSGVTEKSRRRKK